MSHVVADAIADILARKPRVLFICAVNNEEVYRTIFLRSLLHNRYASLTKVIGATSAAQAFNENVVKHPADGITVLVHQDVFLPPYWTDRMEAIFDNTPFGVAGCVGANESGFFAEVYGNRTEYLDFQIEQLPARVDSLDELILVFPSSTPIRLHTELGWHMYGADASAQAKQLGHSALVVRNPVVHCCNRQNYDPSQDTSFVASARKFYALHKTATKTTMAYLDRDGNLRFPEGQFVPAESA